MDAVFVPDTLIIGEDPGKQPLKNMLEPLTLLAALAVKTSRIGLVPHSRAAF